MSFENFLTVTILWSDIPVNSALTSKSFSAVGVEMVKPGYGDTTLGPGGAGDQLGDTMREDPCEQCLGEWT